MADHGMGKNYSLLEQYYEQRFDAKIFDSLQFFLFQPLVNILFIKNFNSNISCDNLKQSVTSINILNRWLYQPFISNAKELGLRLAKLPTFTNKMHVIFI